MAALRPAVNAPVLRDAVNSPREQGGAASVHRLIVGLIRVRGFALSLNPWVDARRGNQLAARTACSRQSANDGRALTGRRRHLECAIQR